MFECLNNDDEISKTLAETKHSLSQRRLRIYIVDSFDEEVFHNLRENENIYIISSELVLICAEKKVVGGERSSRHGTDAFIV